MTRSRAPAVSERCSTFRAARACLVEELSDQVADIVWGQAGEESVVLPMREIESAEQTGKLVLLD